jgi:MarR family transcriptional regulator, organic hydroperoxide resistance regulator
MTATPPGSEPALEREVSFVLSLALRHVAAIYRPLLTAVNLTHVQYLTMLALWQRGPSRVRDLGRVLRFDSGTLSPLLRRLEQRGYVRRERDRGDERAVIVTVTAEGDALRRRVASVPAAVRDRLGLPADELEALLAVLSGVVAAAPGRDRTDRTD